MISTGMRSVYCKARARKIRWKEEICLLLEEMRRVVTYLSWKRNWWLSRRNQRPLARPGVQAGANAYAERQATVFEGLALKFAARWKASAVKLRLEAMWPEAIDAVVASLTRAPPLSSTAVPTTSPPVLSAQVPTIAAAFSGLDISAQNVPTPNPSSGTTTLAASAPPSGQHEDPEPPYTSSAASAASSANGPSDINIAARASTVDALPSSLTSTSNPRPPGSTQDGYENTTTFDTLFRVEFEDDEDDEEISDVDTDAEELEAFGYVGPDEYDSD